MKKDIQEYYKKMGIVLNFSEDKVIKNMFQAFLDGVIDNKNAQKEVKKTKKQQEKEPRQDAIGEMLKKNFQLFYRQLARSWHPDLEQDYKQKLFKEVLMKKLTLAYENNDLSELLSLEMEWLNNLKGHTQDFKVTLDMMWGQKHVPITQFYGHGVDGVSKIKIKYGQLKQGVRAYKVPIKLLSYSKNK